MRKAAAEKRAICQCCALEAPEGEIRVWRERSLCRQLNVLQTYAGQKAHGDDEWVSGLYRYYYVNHEHRVCAPCYAHLALGGQFGGALRNRGKLAFLVLLAIIAVLMASLPVLLPRLQSALWLAPEENRGP